MKNIQVSDLACESYVLDDEKNLKNGIKTTIHSISQYQAIETEILSAKGEELTGKRIGKYLTLCLGNVWKYSEQELEAIIDLIAHSLNILFHEINIKRKSFLVVGLGNKRITSDALGPLTIEKMTPTAHLKEIEESLFNKIGYSLSLLEPKVSATSGQDSEALIFEVTKLTGAECVILIDSLMSKSRLRLCKTLQISNTGIAPGAIRSIKKEISSETLKAPVISIGVPFVIPIDNIENTNDEIFFAPYDVDIIEKAIKEFGNI